MTFQLTIRDLIYDWWNIRYLWEQLDRETKLFALTHKLEGPSSKKQTYLNINHRLLSLLGIIYIVRRSMFMAFTLFAQQIHVPSNRVQSCYWWLYLLHEWASKPLYKKLYIKCPTSNILSRFKSRNILRCIYHLQSISFILCLLVKF